jgi:hypothetical protein
MFASIGLNTDITTVLGCDNTLDKDFNFESNYPFNYNAVYELRLHFIAFRMFYCLHMTGE